MLDRARAPRRGHRVVAASVANVDSAPPRARRRSVTCRSSSRPGRRPVGERRRLRGPRRRARRHRRTRCARAPAGRGRDPHERHLRNGRADRLVGRTSPRSTQRRRSPSRTPTSPASTSASRRRAHMAAWADWFVAELGGTRWRPGRGSRVLYHAALSMASNFTVALAGDAADLLGDPAMIATARRAVRREREPARRGPRAHRARSCAGDAGTVRKHLAALTARAPHLLEVYVANARRDARACGRQRPPRRRKGPRRRRSARGGDGPMTAPKVVERIAELRALLDAARARREARSVSCRRWASSTRATRASCAGPARRTTSCSSASS